MTSRRKFFLVPALTLLASLASAAPSRAASVINVSESFSIKNDAFANSITSVTFSFTGLNGITAETFTGVAVNFFAGAVIPTVSANPGLETVTLTFAPGAALVGGAITFNTTAATEDVSVLAATIQLTGLTIVSATGPYTIRTNPLHFTVVQTIPEPTSSAMFGIGIVLAVGLGWGRRRRELNKLAV